MTTLSCALAACGGKTTESGTGNDNLTPVDRGSANGAGPDDLTSTDEGGEANEPPVSSATWRCPPVSCPTQVPAVDPTECGQPRLTDVTVAPFDADGFDLTFRVRCVEMPESSLDVHIQAFIPEQNVWDSLYSRDYRDVELSGIDDDWALRMHVDHIDETTLADVSFCAGWYVNIYTRSVIDAPAACYALGDGFATDDCIGGGANEPEFVPAAIQCNTLPFVE